MARSALDRALQAADDLPLGELKKTSAGSIASDVNARIAAVSWEYCDGEVCTPSGSVYMVASCSTSSGSR